MPAAHARNETPTTARDVGTREQIAEEVAAGKRRHGLAKEVSGGKVGLAYASDGIDAHDAMAQDGALIGRKAFIADAFGSHPQTSLFNATGRSGKLPSKSIAWRKPVFLLQSSQNRDGAAIQAKLDELIRASAAQNRYSGSSA